MPQLSRCLRSVLLLSSAATVSLLAGCGGGSSSATGYLLTPAEAVLGQPNFTADLANQGKATAQGTLNEPFGGTATNGSVFYIPDYGNNRVLGYDAVPTASGIQPDFVLGQSNFTSNAPNGDSAIATGGFAHPESVWVDQGSGLFAVADTGNNRVLIWSAPPTGDTPPTLILGQATATGNTAGLSASTLNTPTAVAIANGNLFVVDSGNNRVLIWNSIKTLVAGGSANDGAAANVVLGQPDFTSNTPGITIPAASTAGGVAPQGEFTSPTGLWTDGFSLFVSDTGNNRVLYWTSVPSANEAAPNFVIGQSTFTFSTTTVSASTMNAPAGLFSDGTRLFVADKGNNRMLIFNSFPISNGVTASAVLGQEDFTHNTANDDNGTPPNPQTGTQNPNPTQNTLYGPTGVGYANGTLYVTDRGNNRLLLYNADNLPAPNPNDT